MIFANYSRKSVFKDNSDSIKNQSRMSQEYAEAHFPGQVEKFLSYSDEDYSGANADRPDLKRLLSDIRLGRINALIVYQLDRLSRNIKDFAEIYSVLEEHDVQFVSVKENIDTTTPIGKAMMYIIVVFAQMERETIANRVADNMISLARDGWWVGGNPPTGYRRQRIVTPDGKNHVTLEIVSDQTDYITNLFNRFLDNKMSLSAFDTYCRDNNIRTVNDKYLSTSQLHKIFTNPYCVPATPEVYDYFKSKGCQMVDDPVLWDGNTGVMVYGRTTYKNNKHVLASPDNWIVCKGHHKPFIDAKIWLDVQKRFGQNKFDKSLKYNVPLLKGVLKCKCGRMCGMARKHRVDGSVVTWYRCPRRNAQRTCDMSDIKTDILDNAVLDIFREISLDEQSIYKYMSVSHCTPIDTKSISASIKNIELKIEKLMDALMVAENSAASKYVIAQIEKLDKEKGLKQNALLEARKAESESLNIAKNAASTRNSIKMLLKNFDNFTDVQRNAIARDIIKSCVWDGETLHLTL